MAGVYQCVADNGVGEPTAASVQLLVQCEFTDALIVSVLLTQFTRRYAAIVS